MQRRTMWLGMFATAILVSSLYFTGKVHATPAVGFTGTTLSQGRFGSFNVSNFFISPDKHQVWISLEGTKGQSDLYVQSNVWEPGGTTGWHSHPGHSLITVTAGTVTVYEGDDPSCTPHVYTAGMGFVDAGGSHVHIVRNEGTVQAQTIAAQLIPAGQPRRIDAPDPGNCHF